MAKVSLEIASAIAKELNSGQSLCFRDNTEVDWAKEILRVLKPGVIWVVSPLKIKEKTFECSHVLPEGVEIFFPFSVTVDFAKAILKVLNPNTMVRIPAKMPVKTVIELARIVPEGVKFHLNLNQDADRAVAIVSQLNPKAIFSCRPLEVRLETLKKVAQAIPTGGTIHFEKDSDPAQIKPILDHLKPGICVSFEANLFKRLPCEVKTFIDSRMNAGSPDSVPPLSETPCSGLSGLTLAPRQAKFIPGTVFFASGRTRELRELLAAGSLLALSKSNEVS